MEKIVLEHQKESKRRRSELFASESMAIVICSVEDSNKTSTTVESRSTRVLSQVKR